MSEERDFGPQPLATLLERWGLSHHDMVEVSPEQLTYKQVQELNEGLIQSLEERKVRRDFLLELGKIQ